MRVLVIVICAAALWGCGNYDPNDPKNQIEDPRAYAIEAIQTMDLNTWWQAYRNPDPEKIGAIVDEVAERESGGLPKDRNSLDILIRHRLAGRYRTRMDGTDEGKAYILAQAEARFAHPPSAVWDKRERIALLDYHILPGTWRSYSRVGEALMDPPAIGSSPFLKPDVVARSLQRLVSAHPEAKVFQLRYEFRFGSDQKRMVMEFVPDRQIVYRLGGELVFTKHGVVWKDLLAGSIDLSQLDWDSPMEGYDAPPFSAPPKDPFPAAP